MLGSGIGKLYVQTKSSDGSNPTTVWEKSGQQGDKWLQANVTITSPSSYKVLLSFLAVLFKDVIVIRKTTCIHNHETNTND